MWSSRFSSDCIISTRIWPVHKRFIASLVILIIASFVFCSPGEVIPIGDQFYDIIDALFVLNGQTVPSGSRPWTKAEAESELSKLDRTAMSDAVSDIYLQVAGCLENDGSTVRVGLTLSPEIYVHTNEEFNTEDNWPFDYNRRSQILVPSIDISVGGFSFHTELSFGVGRASAEDEFGHYGNLESFPVDVSDRLLVLSSGLYSPIFRSNIPKSSESEVQTPLFAWLTYAWDNGSVGFYKTKKEWGITKLGNYIYDKHVSSYSYVSAKFFNRVVNLDFSIMFPYSYLGGSAKSYEMEYQRVFLSHRLQFQILKNLSVALSENVMYWLKDGFEPLFANPALIYHNNVEDNLFNALAHLEFEFVPLRGLRIYSQIGVDQGSVPGFEDASQEDLAAGLTIGGEYFFLLNGGIASIELEGAMVTPAMYRRGAQYPDFIIADNTIINDNNYTMIPFFTYMGFPCGGDVHAARMGFSYRKGSLNSFFSSTLIWKGEQSFMTPMAGHSTFELTGDVKFYTILESGIEYRMCLAERFPICLKTVIDGVFDPDQGFDIQVTVGASVNVSGSI